VPVQATVEPNGSGPESAGAYRTLARLSDLLQVLDTPEAQLE
jgi:hypothetical protein